MTPPLTVIGTLHRLPAAPRRIAAVTLVAACVLAALVADRYEPAALGVAILSIALSVEAYGWRLPVGAGR